ncbi:MAG: hypothetical protein ACI841_002266 [Planctomycetota bacterium]|jgi:hypothetical protein
MTKIRLLQKRLQRASWLISLGCLAYLFFRFDSLTLPETGCSPVLRYRTGVPLLLDRWPGEFDSGDVVFFADEQESLYLGLVDRSELHDSGRRFWIRVDNPDCPGASSETMGWIPEERIQARVLFAWPF